MRDRPHSILILPAVVTVLSILFTLVPHASAVTSDEWDPGLIIADSVFYDSRSMTAAQIQSFLDREGTSCEPGTAPCLKDYTADTPSMPADKYCSAYAGGTNQSAAAIISKVAIACGINPQVLLVTLQKETSLVTVSAPDDWRYRIAMGYACSDDSPCDPDFVGFFNQVYYAAHQFQIYAALPDRFNYHAQSWNTIAYNPSATCGSSQVYIQNQATASLYNYTPYQPNKAALANLYGQGDSCSAYGNRDFWVLFSDWFSATPPPITSCGQFVDVPSDYVFAGAICWAAENGITKGTGDGSTYSPTNSVNRGSMAAFLYRLAGSPKWDAPKTSPFVDVPTDHAFYSPITWLYSQGVTVGVKIDGKMYYQPSNVVNRGSMSAFLYRLSDRPYWEAPAKSPFTDVSRSHQFYLSITWLADTKITVGSTVNGKLVYQPSNPVNRGSMAAFMNRLSKAQLMCTKYTNAVGC